MVKWLSELTSVLKKYNNTVQNSTKMATIQASEKSNGKLVFDNLQDMRQKQQPKFNLGQLVRTADIKKVFSRCDSTNYSNEIYTIT